MAQHEYDGTTKDMVVQVIMVLPSQAPVISDFGGSLCSTLTIDEGVANSTTTNVQRHHYFGRNRPDAFGSTPPCHQATNNEQRYDVHNI
jgi:hypothetical protein